MEDVCACHDYSVFSGAEPSSAPCPFSSSEAACASGLDSGAAACSAGSSLVASSAPASGAASSAATSPSASSPSAGARASTPASRLAKYYSPRGLFFPLSWARCPRLPQAAPASYRPGPRPWSRLPRPAFRPALHRGPEHFRAACSPGRHGGHLQLNFLRFSSSSLMSIFQPSNFAARRTFCPFLPIARESWLSSITTSRCLSELSTTVT